jgi:hypothetical protein
MVKTHSRPIRLTRKQSRLKGEIEIMAAMIGLDPKNIPVIPRQLRTFTLILAKDHLVRGRVIMRYTQIDEVLSCVIAKAYFPIKKSSDMHQLRRTKKFRVFSHHILDNLYLLNKLRMVHDLKPVTSQAREIVERLNALRNALAHSFYPENRFQYRKKKKLLWRDADIYSFTGLMVFDLECQLAADYFYHRAFGVKSLSLTAIK